MAELRTWQAALLAASTLLVVPPAEGGDFLYWATNNDLQIFESRLPDEAPERVVASWEVDGVVVDLAGGRLYWSEDFKSEEMRLFAGDLDGSNRQLLWEGLGNVEDLELDAAGGWLYWTNESGTLDRVATDGSAFENLLSGLDEPGGLGLDPAGGHVYYLTDSLKTLNRADLDGSNAVALTVVNDSTVEVEVDAANGHLYFGAGSSVVGIVRRDLDGQNPITVLTGEVPSTLELRQGDIYFVAVDRSLQRVGTDGSDLTALLPSTNLPLSRPFDVDLTNEYAYGVGTTDNDNGLDRVEFSLEVVNRTFLVERFSDEGHDLAVDGATGDLYFAEGDNGTLMHQPRQADEASLLMTGESTLVNSRGMVLDAAGGRLYWAKNSPVGTGGGIYSATTAGTGLTTVVPGLERPHDLALDATQGHLYWVDGIADSSSPVAAIRRSDLDGSNVVDIHLGESSSIRGIDLDPTAGKLYWTDHDCDCIHRSDLDGMNRETILDSSDGLAQPHDVAVDNAGGMLYWTEGVGDGSALGARIRRAGLDGSNPVDVHSNLPISIRDLLVARVSFIFTDGFESGDTTSWSNTVMRSAAPGHGR
ncbi:MAG: DUF5050 domain-containing protein [Acidobacteriota bacterium]